MPSALAFWDWPGADNVRESENQPVEAVVPKCSLWTSEAPLMQIGRLVTIWSNWNLSIMQLNSFFPLLNKSYILLKKKKKEKILKGCRESFMAETCISRKELVSCVTDAFKNQGQTEGWWHYGEHTGKELKQLVISWRQIWRKITWWQSSRDCGNDTLYFISSSARTDGTNENFLIWGFHLGL